MAQGLRIGELAQRAGLNPKTIRYYEEVGLLPRPARTASGYRCYGPADVARLEFIQKAKRLGLSLAAIRQVLALRQRGEQPCAYVLELLDRQLAELDRLLAALAAFRAELLALRQEAADMRECDAPGCQIIEQREQLPAAPALPLRALGRALPRTGRGQPGRRPTRRQGGERW